MRLYCLSTIVSLIAIPGLISQVMHPSVPQVFPDKAQLMASHRSVICRVFKPISFSATKDTPQTVSEIRKNNAKLSAFNCGA